VVGVFVQGFAFADPAVICNCSGRGAGIRQSISCKLKKPRFQFSDFGCRMSDERRCGLNHLIRCSLDVNCS